MRSPLLDRRPFIPARYAELRTEAVNILRRATEGFADQDSRAVIAALGDGIRVIQEIDDLWEGRAP